MKFLKEPLEDLLYTTTGVKYAKEVMRLKRLRYFTVDNMKSEEDAKRVREILEGVDGDLRVDVDLDADALEVEYEDEKVNKEMMAKILQSHGYFMRI